MPRKPQPPPTPNRVELTPPYYALPGDTPYHLYDIFAPTESTESHRISVGQLTKSAVDAWANAVATVRAVYNEASGQS